MFYALITFIIKRGFLIKLNKENMPHICFEHLPFTFSLDALDFKQPRKEVYALECIRLKEVFPLGNRFLRQKFEQAIIV